MPLTPINVIDVTDSMYGAVGNGINDDTQAIRDAVNDYYNYLNGAAASYPGDITVYTQPVLYFPKGIYLISGQIDLRGAGYTVKVMGDDAIIAPYSTFNDHAFFHNRCYDVKIEGLNFKNFKKGLYLGNNDGPIDPGTNEPEYEHLESCQWSIISCSFQNCDEALGIFGLSAIVTVEKCKFYKNQVAINITGGDKVTVRDNWITSGNMSHTIIDGKLYRPAQIENHGVLEFSSNLLVPLPPVEGTIEPAWINNYVDVTVSNVRQGAEPSSFTLINNYANWVPYINNHYPTTVSVRDSQCYAVYGCDYEASPMILQPAIVRYVDGVPNSTIIRNNRGLISCTLVDFSYELYLKPGHTGDIDTMMSAPGTPDPIFIIAEVANNAGGVLFGHGSYVPQTLYPYVRGEESLWPDSRRSGALQPIGEPIVDNVTESITYKFNYGASNIYDSFDQTYLINYTGNPNYAGLSGFSGNFVGLVRANGNWTGTASEVKQTLVLKELFNQRGNPNSGGYPTGVFNVQVYWETSNTEDLPPGATNRNFFIKITGRISDSSFDKIKVTPLNSL